MQNNFQQDSDGSFSWYNMGTLMGKRNLAISPNGEALKTIKKALFEYWDKALQEVEMNLIALDKDSVPDLAVSVLVAVLRESKEPDARLSYRTMLIANSIDDLPTERKQIQGFTVDIQVLASEAYDDVMRRVIYSAVRQAFPQVKPEDIHNAGAFLLPRIFQADNEVNLHFLTLALYQPNASKLGVSDANYKPLNAAKAKLDSTLQLKVKYFQPHEMDYSGTPTRADVAIELSSTPSQGNKSRFPTGTQHVTRTTGYVDLLWNQANPNMNNPYMPVMPTAMTNQTYQANLVLTDMRAFQLQTMGSALLALSTAAYVCKDNNFVTALRPVDVGPKRQLMHDIGAIFYEKSVSPDGVPRLLETTPDKFSLTDFANLYQAYFHPGVVLSIDVPRLGENSWLLDVFMQAATGNQDALDYIRHEANVVPNGNFDRFYQQYGGQGRFISHSGNVITNGYYTDETGTMRDIRDVDYLLVAKEMGPHDPTVLSDWTDSFAMTQLDPELREAKRWQIIQQLRPTAVAIGKSDRLNWEPQFIQALCDALAACNCFINTTFHDQYTMQGRANAGYVNGFILSNVNSGIFRAGTFNQMQNMQHQQFHSYAQPQFGTVYQNPIGNGGRWGN